MTLLDPQSRPLTSLVFIFTLWKLFLHAIALGASIGPDYDTSTSLFFTHVYGPQAAIPSLAQRLTRWDALYFVHAARAGKLYEQEWAFGIGQSGLVSGLTSLLPSQLYTEGIVEPLVGIVVANLSHLISVVALYKLTSLIFSDRRLAYVTAILHTISPAGLFLSAPYAESPFSCLSFVGNYLFALSYKHRHSTIKHGLSLVTSGVCFGVACLFRSNGLASGLLFAIEAARCLISFTQKPGLSSILSLVFPVVGGIYIAMGFAAPQVLAWMRYCGDIPMRPWCLDTIPSIYGFVQEHYWNVGFLRYWTPNQIPLFLLAAPVLAMLIKSSVQILREPSSSLKLLAPGTNEPFRLLVRALAATELFVAVLAITSYHVQIINRLASGYVVWYWWIASCILDGKRRGLGLGIVVFFVMYAGIQGSLFASFLPPA